MKEALERLEGLNVDELTKRQVGDVLKAASNPHAESISVVARTLPKERRGMVNKTAQEVRAITTDVMQRGRAALEKMSDEQWERLIDESTK